jgi:hypothetical protein
MILLSTQAMRDDPAYYIAGQLVSRDRRFQQDAALARS